MVVDDTPANIKILVEALREDYDVMVATRGAQALELAHTDPKPDLILLDMMMPEMDGHDVCRALKDDPETQSIPIIFVTADSTPENEEKSFDLGAVDYVTKPYSLPVVRARVRTHILLKHRTDALERLAQMDGLTGIANRRRFDDLLRSEWERCSRQELPISVIMADVDHFKLYNDTYGHGAGDHCLRQMGIIMRTIAGRPGDLAARYGGEEFAILLANTPFEGAGLLAEKFRAAVEEHRISSRSSNTSHSVTVSVGYATATPRPGMDAEHLLQQADEMLYKAKSAGRNTVRGVNLDA
jgi:diguanylate cyclase (GGDEF)-like protein